MILEKTWLQQVGRKQKAVREHGGVGVGWGEVAANGAIRTAQVLRELIILKNGVFPRACG